LSHPNTIAPSSDCWVANLADQTPDDLSGFREAGLPPPAPASVLEEGASGLPSRTSGYTISWSADGQAVSASIDDEPIAFIIADRKPGFHAYIRTDCPWGQPFDANLHRQLFG
jgi:hypothetical protein